MVLLPYKINIKFKISNSNQLRGHPMFGSFLTYESVPSLILFVLQERSIYREYPYPRFLIIMFSYFYPNYEELEKENVQPPGEIGR